MKLKDMAAENGNSLFRRINFKDISGKIIISSLFYVILILMLVFNRKKYLYDVGALSKLFMIVMIQLLLVYFTRKYIDNFSPYLISYNFV